MKKIYAVKPFVYPNNSNFKLAVFNSWVNEGGKCIDERWYRKYYKRIILVYRLFVRRKMLDYVL